jgi:uncharacterized protein
MIIERRRLPELRQALTRQAAVVLLGPRQVGKTTLARIVAGENDGLYLDLESGADQARLADPELYLAEHAGRLVVLDEIQRLPKLFESLRGLIDEGRRSGRGVGRFLLLGSASLDLMRQSSESLAGRVRLLELSPFDVLEVGPDAAALDQLWLRGGFPGSYLAADEDESRTWRQDFIRSYLEREIPQLGPRIPAETLRRFWTMLAHTQGGLLNASRLGSGLGVKGQTVSGYADLLVDLLLVRRLQPYQTNAGKRLVKAPKLYIRDSGIVHALLGIADREALLGHPVVGGSWEGFVIETLIGVAPPGTVPGFYRTAAGAEIDLVLELPGGPLWVIEIKRGLAPNLEKGFHLARADIGPAASFVVYSGTERYPMAAGIEAIGLRDLAKELLRVGHRGTPANS